MDIIVKEYLPEKRILLMVAPKVGVNLIVYTPQEIRKMLKQNHYFLIDEILGKGNYSMNPLRNLKIDGDFQILKDALEALSFLKEIMKFVNKRLK